MSPPATSPFFHSTKTKGLSEHTALYDATITILEGECEVMAAGKTHRMKEGEPIIFPANTPHAVFTVKKFETMRVRIRERHPGLPLSKKGILAHRQDPQG